LVGPDLWDGDFALMKNTKVTKISDTFTVQFRAEFFNILNHPSFSTPSNGIFVSGGGANPTGGRITAVTSTPRQIQFALKLIF
jgi:hypothetical protein